MTDPNWTFTARLAGVLALLAPGFAFTETDREADESAMRNAYFGELHVHTTLSFDAFTFGLRATPDDAYRYGKGEAIKHPFGYPIRLRGEPLDFVAVTDHAEYLGVAIALADPGSELGNHPLGKKMQTGKLMERMGVYLALRADRPSGQSAPMLDAAKIIRSAWQQTIDAAERHNDPGRFTTLVAYEYSSAPGGANLHRNVIFASADVPERPFSATDSPNPEALWNWLDQQRAKGIEALAIPHNSNWSQGKMFERTNWAGEPIDAAYAEQRLRNEPLVEITQIKGTSETHPALSPNDEWADFEIWRNSKSVPGSPSLVEGAKTGAYVRDALRAGLEMEQETGANPYRFGVIGSSDSHNAAAPVEEDQYFGKDRAIPQPMPEWGASGLAGVWAEENTRQSIYAALRRKETFATSGPRIRVRFFAGYEYADDLPKRRDAAQLAYAGGVSMGGELAVRGASSPKFLVWAARDPQDVWLQRAQIVKGWIASSGKSQERVFDVGCSDGVLPDPKTHRCPDNGAKVNLNDCSTTLDKGDVELRTVWRDPTFDPAQRSFYYARVLQNPTCRWTTWDAIAEGVEPAPEMAATIQERAWSSPIWMAPADG